MSCELQVLVDITGSITFIGEAAVGSAQSSSDWRITRIDTATSGVIISFADGVTTFTKAWSGRAGFSYTIG